MNAKTVRKWISRNAPEYRLVRTEYIMTLQQRAADASELLDSTSRELTRQIATLTDQAAANLAARDQARDAFAELAEGDGTS